MKKLISMLLALVMVFALAACSGGGAGEGESAATQADALKGKTIGYVTITSTAPWGGRVGTELERLAKEAGADVKVLDAQTDVAKVAEYCQQMIDAGVDALSIFGGDYAANGEIVKAAAEAGIPVFMCAMDVPEEYREYVKAVIGPDQKQMTYDIGQYVIEKNGADSGATVAIISGVPFLQDYIDRDAGIAEALAATNYNVLETAYAFSSRTDAKAFAEQWLQAYGDELDIIIGLDDDLTMGAVQAVEEAGKLDQVKIYSLTGQNDAIQAVADGKLQSTVMMRADDISAETVKAMQEFFFSGETEYYHRTPLTPIDSSNVKDYIGKGEF